MKKILELQRTKIDFTPYKTDKKNNDIFSYRHLVYNKNNKNTFLPDDSNKTIDDVLFIPTFHKEKVNGVDKKFVYLNEIFQNDSHEDIFTIDYIKKYNDIMISTLKEEVFFQYRKLNNSGDLNNGLTLNKINKLSKSVEKYNIGINVEVQQIANKLTNLGNTSRIVNFDNGKLDILSKMDKYRSTTSQRMDQHLIRLKRLGKAILKNIIHL